MEITTLFIVAIVVWIIGLMILYFIIGSATKAKELRMELNAQTRILSLIAEKLGVPVKEIAGTVINASETVGEMVWGGEYKQYQMKTDKKQLPSVVDLIKPLLTEGSIADIKQNSSGHIVFRSAGFPLIKYTIVTNDTDTGRDYIIWMHPRAGASIASHSVETNKMYNKLKEILT